MSIRSVVTELCHAGYQVSFRQQPGGAFVVNVERRKDSLFHAGVGSTMFKALAAAVEQLPEDERPEVLEQPRSEAQKQAARHNGRKGGRPRKLRDAFALFGL